MKKLFTTQYGSRLYGTNTPESDMDLKHVVLPELNDLLLGKQVINVVKKTNNQKFTRNSDEDIDTEFIPLQVFAKDFLGGQTYALELAYAVDYTEAGQVLHDPLFKGFCAELRSRFLTSNMTALIGYAVNQASLYSFKGERLNAVRGLEKVFKDMIAETPSETRANDYVKAFEEAMMPLTLEFPKYIQLSEYAINHEGTMRPCVKMLEKVLPYTSTFSTNLGVVKASLKKYGSRADAASIDNVDWKAVAHAMRIVDEGIQLLTNRYLFFPYKDDYVKFFLEVKQGKIEHKVVIDLINLKLSELKDLEAISTLPKKSFELEQSLNSFLLEWLRMWYNLPVSV